MDLICSSAAECSHEGCRHRVPHQPGLVMQCHKNDLYCSTLGKKTHCVTVDDAPAKEATPTTKAPAKVVCDHAAGCSTGPNCDHWKPHKKSSDCRDTFCHDRRIHVACIPVSTEVKDTKKETTKKETTKKENTNMSKSLTARVKSAGSAVIAKQPEMIKTAAMLEGSSIVLDKAMDLLRPKLPFWAKGLADHPAAKALLANALMIGTEIAFPDAPETDLRKQFTAAGAVGSYQDILKTFDLGGMLDTLFDSPEVQKAMAKVEMLSPAATKPKKAATAAKVAEKE